MTDNERIEEMARIIHFDYWGACGMDSCSDCPHSALNICKDKIIAEKLYNKLFPEGSVVLSKEEYEKMKSLYDCQQGAYMTSQIGDLPLTVDGLRKAVDEITRLVYVQTELQELNAKYYNEAKDLRRVIKEARKETAREYYKAIKKVIHEREYIEGYADIGLQEENDKIAKQYGVEVEE